MGFIDKSYYFMYCFNTVKKDVPLNTLDDKALAARFGASKRLYALTICLYVSAIFMYSNVLFFVTKNPGEIEGIVVSIYVIIFAMIYFYFTKRENEIVKRYMVLRGGKENGDWIKGFAFFVLSIVVLLMSV
jgi:hypothetical protein